MHVCVLLGAVGCGFDGWTLKETPKEGSSPGEVAQESGARSGDGRARSGTEVGSGDGETETSSGAEDAGGGAPVPDPGPADAASPPPPLPAYRVFVTRGVWNGAEFGDEFQATDLSDGDRKCAEAASRGGLSGKFVAWLSTSSAYSDPSEYSARSRVISRMKKLQPVVLAKSGTKVAAKPSELLTKSLLHAIDEDELGTAGVVGEVWTGSHGNGTCDDDGAAYDSCPFDTCGYWSDGDDWGEVGSTTATNLGWTATRGRSCREQHHLYCFQVD